MVWEEKCFGILLLSKDGAVHIACCTVFVSSSPSASLLVTAVQCSEDVCKLKSSQNGREISQGIPVMFSSSFLFQKKKKRLNFLTFQACFQFHGSVRLGKGDLGVIFCKRIFEIQQVSNLKGFCSVSWQFKIKI